MGEIHEAEYFVQPIWQMFDFKGATGRAEYFTYAVTSFLLPLILTVATHLFSTVNWTMIVSSENAR